MNVSEFLHQIAIASGVESDSPELKLILADANLASIQVPSTFDALVTNKYKDMVTLEAAKNHPDLKKYFYGTSLTGVDKYLEKIAHENEFSEDELTGLKKITNTHDRIQELFKQAKDKYEKKTPPSDEEKHKKLGETIKTLNEQLLQKDEAFKAKEKELQTNYHNSLRDRTVNELFQKYPYTDAIPKNVQVQTAKALFFEDLKEKNYKIAFNPEGDNLKLLTSEDTEVFINNKPVDIYQYTESLLAENKLLRITTKQVEENKREPIIVQPQNGQGGKTLNTSVFMQAMEVAAQDAARITN